MEREDERYVRQVGDTLRLNGSGNRVYGGGVVDWRVAKIERGSKRRVNRLRGNGKKLGPKRAR